MDLGIVGLALMIGSSGTLGLKYQKKFTICNDELVKN